MKKCDVTLSPAPFIECCSNLKTGSITIELLEKDIVTEYKKKKPLSSSCQMAEDLQNDDNLVFELVKKLIRQTLKLKKKEVIFIHRLYGEVGAGKFNCDFDIKNAPEWLRHI